MMTEFFYDSQGEGRIHACRWTPEGEIRGVVQLVHGIAEHTLRYDGFARYLNSLGFLVTAEDHMGHGKSMVTQGYFAGGWFTAVEDTVRLLNMTREEFPGKPYFLFGHSMGSFITRTILEKHPELPLAGAVICGTGWMPAAVLAVGETVCRGVCRKKGEREPSEALEKLVFGGYNKRVEHPRTAFDWLSRDNASVDAYIGDPLCGFTASAGLLRDMLGGIRYNQKPENLRAMNRELPVFFIAGGDDPVGSYGSGVRRAAEAFRKAGMKDVSLRIYPLCRHEILNEINREEIYEDVAQWLEKHMG